MGLERAGSGKGEGPKGWEGLEGLNDWGWGSKQRGRGLRSLGLGRGRGLRTGLMGGEGAERAGEGPAGCGRGLRGWWACPTPSHVPLSSRGHCCHGQPSCACSSARGRCACAEGWGRHKGQGLSPPRPSPPSPRAGPSSSPSCDW